VGKLTPAAAAAGVIDTIASGKDEHTTPVMLALTAACHSWAPRPVQWIINVTGWSVSKQAASGGNGGH
jgi:hypothetical protein